MPDAVILSEQTYQRLIKMLEKWEKGEIIQPGEGLKTLETGTGYQKLGVDIGSNVSFPTLNANVCINGVAVSKNFLIKL